MESYFFSKENIGSLTKNLSKKLGIKNTNDSLKACQKFLEKQMRGVYTRYGDKKPKGIPLPEFIERLNEKSMSECIKLYEAKTGKKSTNKDMGKYKMDRDQQMTEGKRTGVLK